MFPPKHSGRSSLASFIVFLILAQITRAANGICFLRNGEIATNAQPCNPPAEVSHCCESGKHICLSNNLCFDIGVNHLIEAACTDRTWQNPACPQYCKANATLSVWGDIRQCDNTNDQWVCGQDPSNCKNHFSVPSGFVDDRRVDAQSAFLNLPSACSTVSVASSRTQTASSTNGLATGTGDLQRTTATVIQSSTSGAVASATSGSSSSAAMTAGLGAGLGVGIPLLIALLTSLFFLARAEKQIKQLQTLQSGTGKESETMPPNKQHDYHQNPQHELKSPLTYSEVPAYSPQQRVEGGRTLVEAPGDYR